MFKNLLIVMTILFILITPVFATDLYLRNGNFNWSDPNAWSYTSNGDVAGIIPDPNVSVYADPNSGSAVLTVNATSYCKSLDMTGFTGTLGGGSSSISLFCNGNCTFSNTMTSSVYKILLSNSNLTTNGLTLNTHIYCYSGTINLLDNLTTILSFYISSAVAGTTCITNNHNITCMNFNLNDSTAKTITLGSSVLTCVYLDTSGTNTTFNYDTSTVIVNQSATGAMSFTPGTAQFYNLTLNGFNDKVSTLSLASNLTVNNTLSLQGNTINNRLWLKSSVTGTPRTVTAASVDLDNVDFQDIAFAGAATWEGVSLGNCGGNSGTITYTTPVTRYFKANGGNWSGNVWSETSGGATGASVPICHDTAIIDPNSTITSGYSNCDIPRMGKDIIITDDCELRFSQDSYVFGSLILNPNMTLSGTARKLFFESRSDCSLTTGGLTIPHGLYFNNYGSEISLFGNLTTTYSAATYQALIFNSGTFNASNYNVTSTTVRSTNPQTTNIKMGNGNWDINGNKEATWYFYNTNGLTTIQPGNSTIVFSNQSNSSIKELYNYLNGVNPIFNNIKFTGLDILKIYQNNTFNILESDTTAGSNKIQITTGTTQTLTKLFANTEPTKKLTLQSTTSTPAVLTANTQDQFLRYCDPNYITFNGTKNWYADPNTCTITNCTGIVTTRNFSTFNTLRNTYNPNIKLGGNTTSKY